MRPKGPSELVRKTRTICMNEAELTMVENIMDYYRLHNVSETVRFLVIKENQKITENSEKAVEHGR